VQRLLWSKVLMANARISEFMTSLLSQLFVLPLSFLQDGNIRVRIFPEREEILIRLARFRRVARANLRPDFVTA